MKAKEKIIKKIVEDLQSIFVRNPSDKTWHEIGKILADKGWKKTFADCKGYKVTEDDVRTSFLLLTNFADELMDIAEEKQPFVDKVHFALIHLKIYQLQKEFDDDNSGGYYESVWKKYKKMETEK